MSDNPDDLFERIGAAGAAFVGPDTPEAAGDYLAGPSHVLPTGGAVRFSSPLGVYDFVTRTSYIRYEAASLRAHAGRLLRWRAPKGSPRPMRAPPRSASPSPPNI